MQEFWNGLALRERMLLVGMSLLVAITLIYVALWEPYVQEKQLLQQRIANQQQDLHWMQGAAQSVQQLQQQSGGSTKQRGSTPLLTLVDKTAKSFGLAESIERIQPEGKRVQIRYKAAEFDAMVRWLDQLQRQYALVITTMVVERTEQPGRVDARIVIGDAA